MAVDYIAQITELSRNNQRLSVSDDHAGYPQFIQSQSTWKRLCARDLKPYSGLKIHALCAKKFVKQEQHNNAQVLRLFLHALSNRYDYKNILVDIININNDTKLDFTCQNASIRTIHQVVDKLDHVYGRGEARNFRVKRLLKRGQRRRCSTV